MKLYKTTIHPISTFSTPIKGDTLFGHLCWMIVYKFGKSKLNDLLETYKNGKPFLIVSDGFYSNYLPKPKMPSFLLGEDDNKKENRKKIWLSKEDLLQGNYFNAKKETDIVFKKDKEVTVVKNSINYELFKTDESGFAPYSVKEYVLNPKDIYFLLDENQFSLNELKEIFELLSEHGYGKDITIGKGRFEFDDFEEVNLNFVSKTYMTLSPAALNKDLEINKLYYEPFVRFGKFGGEWAYKNAFKKPILFLDTAAVINFVEEKERKFIGKAITNIALSEDKDQQNSVMQGYSILFPIKDIQ